MVWGGECGAGDGPVWGCVAVGVGVLRGAGPLQSGNEVQFCTADWAGVVGSLQKPTVSMWTNLALETQHAIKTAKHQNPAILPHHCSQKT